MESKDSKKQILQYRQSHPKCKWCKWYKYNYVPVGMSMANYETCELKDSIIHFSHCRRFCKYYQVKDSKELLYFTKEENKIEEQIIKEMSIEPKENFFDYYKEDENEISINKTNK